MARIPLSTEGVTSDSFDQQNLVLSLILSPNPFITSTGSKVNPMVTPILGVTSGHVTNLINRTVPFVITLRIIRTIASGERLVGARWNQYMDQWSMEQCQILEVSDSVRSRDLCHKF